MPEAVDRANELSRLASKAKVALNAQKARAGRIAKMHKSLSKNLFQAKKMMKSKNDPLLVSLNDGVETARILMEEEKALVGKFETEYDACEQEAKDAIDEAVSYGKVMSDFWSGKVMSDFWSVFRRRHHCAGDSPQQPPRRSPRIIVLSPQKSIV